MTNKILILGSTGFIGSEIFKNINQKNNYKVFRYSTKLDQPIDFFDIRNEKFDVLIFASGIHGNTKQYKNIFIENKKILKILFKLLKNTTKCVFISSFKTSIEMNKKIIKEDNVYDFFKKDSDYGKVKIIAEKIGIRILKKNKIDFKIVSPSHVIGPSLVKSNPNNIDILNKARRLINFVPNCYLSFIDVRDVANYIFNLIENNNFDNKKIILNTENVLYKDYIKKIRKNKLNIIFEVNDKLIILISRILRFITFFIRTKFNVLTNFHINYILTKKITVINKNIPKNYTFETSIKNILESD
tara:strand:+ start:2029 stop:2931 length:903 start_codon:yes stop_codon:yes gene_type:complete